MPIPGPDDVRVALERHGWRDLPPLPGRTNHLSAGILVPLMWDPEPVVIVTRHSLELRTHAGEVCFPGGRPDPSDPDLLSTALREAREEIGIDEATVLGRLSSMPLYTSDFRLVPFVAAIPPQEFRPAPGEVAEVLRLPVLELLDRPSLEGIGFEWEGRTEVAPIFRPGGHLMFGGTAYTFLELLRVIAPLFGRQLPPLQPGSLTWAEVLSPRDYATSAS